MSIISFFHHKHKKQLYQDYLIQLLKHINQLQYESPTSIIDICTHLRIELRAYTIANSKAYNNFDRIVTKDDLQNKDKWYVNIPQAANASTSGSTSATKFHYKRWNKIYTEIEGTCHYKAIAQEFNIPSNPQILYLMMDIPSDNQIFSTTIKTPNVLISHGYGHDATIHVINRTKLYYENYQDFYKVVIEYASANNIDIILASGNTISALTWNIRRLKHTSSIGKLLSSTGEKTNLDDLQYLQDNGLITNWCDHMRCWDGGVTFYTCKYHTPHLIDGLAWASTIDNKLVSDDYYSLASPFVNYWNGDYATIGPDFQKCQCGRYYREFAISRTRDTALSGINNTQVRNSIMDVGVADGIIKRAERIGTFTRIFTTQSLSAETRDKLRNTLPELLLNFVTEEPHD